MPRPSRPPDLNKTYPVVGCAHCQHPGGAHVIDQWEPRVTHCRIDQWEPRVTHCRYCHECPGWADGPSIRWSGRMSQDAEARMAASG